MMDAEDLVSVAIHVTIYQSNYLHFLFLRLFEYHSFNPSSVLKSKLTNNPTKLVWRHKPANILD